MLLAQTLGLIPSVFNFSITDALGTSPSPAYFLPVLVVWALGWCCCGIDVRADPQEWFGVACSPSPLSGDNDAQEQADRRAGVTVATGNTNVQTQRKDLSPRQLE